MRPHEEAARLPQREGGHQCLSAALAARLVPVPGDAVPAVAIEGKRDQVEGRAVALAERVRDLADDGVAGTVAGN